MRMYAIKYEVIGSRNEREVDFAANSFADAVKQFTEWEQDSNGIKWTYNESAINSIEPFGKAW